MTTNARPNLFALLIGIDRYSQVPLSDGSLYPHLGGCVRDINHVEQMLRSRLSLTDEQITKLISSNSKDGKPAEAADKLPTYKNLVRVFKTLTEKAQPGDHVYIHYSGHGGRSKTMFPKLKGESGLDESLVPCDIGEKDGNYLRDIEMAYLLKAMSEKGLIVTLVLDSCHSGGATRGNGGAFPRCIPNFIDMSEPPQSSAVASKDELLAAFSEISAVTRNVASASGWRLPTPNNFVLLSACQANELANEYAFDGKERNGALTYWMLDSLKQMGEGFTYKMLYNRVKAKVHTKFTDQTPLLEGEGDRELFGAGLKAATATVNVIKIDQPNERIQLSTGLAQGVGKGTQFAIFPANVTDFTNRAQRLGVVELEEPGTTDSWARIVEGDNADQIQEGAQAVLLGIGIRLRGRVYLVPQDNSADGGGAPQNSAIENLRALITQDDGEIKANEKWIRLVGEGEEADFQVAVNSRGEFEIWDPSGRPLPNLRPALKADDAGAAEKLVQRLMHLTKYRNVRLIDNTDTTSPLTRKIVAELGKRVEESGGKVTFTPFGTSSHPISVGEEVCLRITNHSKLPVNITILDLQPDWGISQVYPDPQIAEYELLDLGEDNALFLPMKAWLPEDYQRGIDTLKIFATVEGTGFRWLEMSALDQPITRGGGAQRAAGDPLEQLLASFAEPTLTRQMINLSAPKGRTWATTQVEVHVRRPTIAHVPDPALSLLQSAFDQVTAEESNGELKTRSVNGQQQTFNRPELSDPIINDVTQYCLALARNQVTESELTSFDQDALSDAQKRGVVDVVKYCASMAAGAAREWFNARISGDDIRYNQYKQAIEQNFGNCDPRYSKALIQFLQFLKDGGQIAYRKYDHLSNFVIDGRLPDQATIGIVADWGTGEPEAIEVLRQVKVHNPDIAIHLGDIYYAGTEYEIENYFFQPWQNVLELNTSKILSLALPGNHDYYASGKPYYDLIDRLAQINNVTDENGNLARAASYFCLRNKHWQIIGMDTAMYDRLGGGPTHLEASEAAWVIDKIQNAGERRTILLSHHQLFSANDQFAGKSYNKELYKQLEQILPQVDLWLWGHEHDLVIFGEYMNLKRGRCIGGSAFPVGNFEMPATRKNPEVPFNQQIELSKGTAFYQHCYTILKLDNANAIVSYYEDRDGGRLVFEETL